MIKEILLLFSWTVLIYFSYFMVKMLINKYELNDK